MTAFDFLDSLPKEHKRFEIVNRLSISFKVRFWEASDIYDQWKSYRDFIDGMDESVKA